MPGAAADGTLDLISDEDLMSQEIAQHARHEGTRVLPVFVLTLKVRGEEGRGGEGDGVKQGER